MKLIRLMEESAAIAVAVKERKLKAFDWVEGLDAVLEAADMVLGDFLESLNCCSDLETFVLQNSDLDFAQMQEVVEWLAHSNVKFADLRNNGFTRAENIRLAFELLENEVSY
jgi:hypothetical protein